MNMTLSGWFARQAGRVVATAGLLAAVASVGAQGRPAAAPIILDTSQIDALAKFARQADGVAKAWYPRIGRILGVETLSTEPITIRIGVDIDGVAATGGRTIGVSARYVVKQPNDLGMIVHELVHVVQGYPKYDPVWLVEGIADYVRFYHYEPISARPHPNPDRASCRDSYRTTGCFLDWACRTYDKDLVKKLNRALAAGSYSESIWPTLTGKDLDTLNREWLASLSAR
jgi:hypothetical protein